MRAPIAAAFLLLAACVTPEPPIAPPTPPLGGDYARLEGTWVVTHNEAYGVPLPERNGALFIFKGDRIKRSTDAGDEQFALDESVTPKRIDFHDPRQADIRGIYKLNGDELVICTNSPDGVRPTEFVTGLFTGGAILTRFTRRKAEP